MSEQAEPRNVHQRLAAVMAKVTYIQKEQKEGMKYPIVSHDVVTAKVRPALLAEGIVYYPVRCEHAHNGNRAECGMTVRFVNIDNPNDYFDVPTFGYGIDTQDKGPGKAMSYAVKYALLKALGLETGEDADHDSIDHDPTPTPAEIRTSIKAAIQNSRNMQDLQKVWGANRATIQALSKPMQNELTKAKDDKKAQWSAVANDPAGQAPQGHDHRYG